MIDSFILDDFLWSFSKADCFDECPLQFKMQYIDCLQGIDNVFGQYGTMNHSILQDFYTGKIGEFELVEEYEKRFPKYVTEYFPAIKNGNMYDSYYNAGYEYFSSFTPIDEEILGVEQKYYFKIGNYNFTGIIDLETPTKIIDHKSKSKLHLEKLTKKHAGKDMVTMIDGRFIELPNFYQLYIYCIPYKEKHGHYPKQLELNMFKIQDTYTINFNEKDFNKAKDWCIRKIEEIYTSEVFDKGKSVEQFFCNNICSMRLQCKYSDKYMGT